MTSLVFVIPLSAPSLVSFEIPKSRTFTQGTPSTLCVRNRFAGFRSRCTMPRLCASASASQAWSTHSATSWMAWPPCVFSSEDKSWP